MRTSIKLTVTTPEGRSLAPFFRVALDANKAPFIVVADKKVFIQHTNFPTEFSPDLGHSTLIMDVKEGLEDLKALVNNLHS